MNNAESIKSDLEKLIDPEKAAFLPKFSKLTQVGMVKVTALLV